MASSSRAEPKTLVEESSEDDDARPSTSGPNSRNNHYDQQRIGRRSRPTSGESSQAAPRPRPKGKRASYQEPESFLNLDEVEPDEPVGREGQESLEQTRSGQNPGFEGIDEAQVPEPLGPEKQDSLEQKRATQVSPKTGRDTKNSSNVRRRTSGNQKGQTLSETAAPPPVQQPSEPPTSSSTTAQKRRLLEDAEDGDADSDSQSASPPFVQRRPEDYLPRKKQKPPPQVSKKMTELYTISYLIFFSFLGTLARLGVQWLTFYPGAPIVTPVIWANFAGSLIMGFLSEDQGLFRDGVSTPPDEKRSSGRSTQSDLERLNKAEHAKRKKTIPLYIGLATGFCGSFTSFSSFARDMFLALSNNEPSPVNHPNAFAAGAGKVSATSTVSRNGGYSFMAWAAIVFMTLTLCLGGLIAGGQIALFLHPVTSGISKGFTRRVLDPSVVFLGFGCWLGAIFLCIWPPDRPGGPSSRGSWANETWRGEVLFALVFAPVGCLLRFYASIKLNGLVPSFPLGTFAVNMLGTAVEGMCYDIQHVGVGVMGRVGGGRVGCQVLQGVMDGFCGCLTTISTWVAEINGLRRKHGWMYAFASVIGALCLMVVIMGSVRWSVGFGETACNTGYTDKIHG